MRGADFALDNVFAPTWSLAYYDDKYQGYLWIFPKNKDTANVGFGSIVKGVNVKKALFELMSKINPSMKEISSYSGVVPCSGPIERTYYDRWKKYHSQNTTNYDYKIHNRRY